MDSQILKAAEEPVGSWIRESMIKRDSIFSRFLVRELARSRYSILRRVPSSSGKVNDETPWEAKLDPAFWRGDALLGHGIKARDSLLTVASSGPNVDAWSDVKHTSFWESGPDIGKIVSPPEHCRHKFLIHSEGVAYSVEANSSWAVKVPSSCTSWSGHNTSIPPSSPLRTPRTKTRSSCQENTSKPSPPPCNPSSARKRALPTQQKSTLFGAIRPLTTGQKIAQNAKRTLTDRYLTPPLRRATSEQHW